MSWEPPHVHQPGHVPTTHDYRSSLDMTRPDEPHVPSVELPDHSRTSIPTTAADELPSRRETRSYSFQLDEFCRRSSDRERSTLNGLNTRFVDYLYRIRSLVNANAHLRQQIDQIYQQHLGRVSITPDELRDRYPIRTEFLDVCKQLNGEVSAQMAIKIRTQRAEYDRKFYANNIKSLLVNDQNQNDEILSLKHQLDAKVYECDQVKKQCERQEENLQVCQQQYQKYLSKLTDYADQYDRTMGERMQKESTVSTLRERVEFEREYYQRRKQEFKNLEKIQFELNRQFNQTESANMMINIR